jgi:hypothetical protein
MKQLLLLFSVSVFAFGCKKTVEVKLDIPCQEGGVSLGSLEGQYGCVNTKYGLQLNASDSVKIIRSQQEFEAHVTGSCLPAIDFNMFTLIIGKKQLQNDNTAIEYNAVRDCDAGKINLEVYITNNLGLAAPIVTWHTLLPKLADGERVDVSFSIH